jgi:hypothetical protein
MWFDIIKTDISALLNDLQNTEGLEVPELIEEIERLKEIEGAKEGVTNQPFMEESKTIPSMSDIVDPLDDLLEEGLKELIPIVQDREITPEETQQIENSKWWLALQRKNPNLHRFATKTQPKPRIRQV